MQLIGMLDSPYVRRVAISLKLMGLPFEHRSLSVFRNFDDFATVNPLVKAPTLIADDGTVLMESSLILEHIEAQPGSTRSLVPGDPGELTRMLRFVGLALTACEKAVQIYYEHQLRPEQKRHQPWLDRVQGQLEAAFGALDREVAGREEWLVGGVISQADVTIPVAWTFTRFVGVGDIRTEAYPALAAYVARMEALPEFASTPLD